MGVYIKNAPMPDSCDNCDFYYEDRSEGVAYCIASGSDITPVCYNRGKRDSNCPLVEIKSPHGRLIDASLAEEKSYEPTIYDLTDVPDFLAEQPTVIDSEK